MKSKHFQKVSVLFDEILPVNLKQKAFIYNNIFNNWKQIVGEDISDITIPSFLKFKKNKLNIVISIWIKLKKKILPKNHPTLLILKN